MAQVIPYLKFEEAGCREAMEFYHGIFGGKLELQTVGETPMKDFMPPEAHSSVMHSALIADGITIYGSDMVDERGAKTAFGLALAYVGTGDEVNAAWAKLVEDGEVMHELKEEYFGIYGDLKDKYGFYWMFQADAPKES